MDDKETAVGTNHSRFIYYHDTMQENTKKDNIELEEAEISRMVRDGFSFVCEYQKTKRKWYGKKYSVKVSEEFTIKEPTLGTLDRISREVVKIAEAEQKISDSIGVAETAIFATKYTKLMCRALAIAVVDSGANVYCKGRYEVDEREVERITDVIYGTISPRDLKLAMNMMFACENMADFIACIVLMSINRTSRPDAIQEREG